MKYLRRTIRKILLEAEILLEWPKGKIRPEEADELAELLDSEDYRSITKAIKLGEQWDCLRVNKTRIISHSGVQIWNLELTKELHKAVEKRQHRESTGMSMEVGWYDVTVKAYSPMSPSGSRR